MSRRGGKPKDNIEGFQERGLSDPFPVSLELDMYPGSQSNRRYRVLETVKTES